MTDEDLAMARQLLTQLGGDVERAGGKVLLWNQAAKTPGVVLWPDTGQISAHLDGLPENDKAQIVEKLEGMAGPAAFRSV
jgi:hypothetical protein